MNHKPRLLPEPAYQVERLRDAAAHLGGPSAWAVSIPIRVNSPWEPGSTIITHAHLPVVMCKPLRGILREAAERIERAGSPLGLPVSYALELAGAILDEDLGHNR